MHKSSAMLEREFFRAFFAALIANGVSRLQWRSADTDRRFRRVYEFLRTHAHDEASVRLVERLRPDPISGSNPALNANLVNMQPGNVTAPNPGYEVIKLSGTKDRAKKVLEGLQPDFQRLVSGAVEAYIQAPESPSTDDPTVAAAHASSTS